VYDIVIIGAGVIGCSVARFLSRYEAKVCVIEKHEDVCSGTSKANSAIMHAGFDAKHGSLMAKTNVTGSKMMPDLAKELDIPYTQNGSLVVCLDEDNIPRLTALYENGIKNDVEGLEIIDGKRLREMEPNIKETAVAALFAPTGAIVCPFELTAAMAENAYTNGVEFLFNTEARGLSKRPDGGWSIITNSTNNPKIDTKYVVNAAGVYSDYFHNLVSKNKINITPRRGDYFLLDKSEGDYVKHTIFQLPDNRGKGVLISPTVHGNIIVGPTSIDVNEKEGTNTTAQGLNEIIEKASVCVNNIPLRQVITSFAGLRAHEDGAEFIIGEPEDAEGFYDCAGIASPGLTAAPAVGLKVAEDLKNKFNLAPNPNFNGTRKGPVLLAGLSIEERNKLIKENPLYGNIICRCEEISEGEIVDAIKRPLGAKSMDGIKRRTRAGMGRCQAGFCTARTMDILARELGITKEDVTKCGGNSRLIVGKKGSYEKE
jgi:glycerol-3-phosphate dehydrogenase